MQKEVRSSLELEKGRGGYFPSQPHQPWALSHLRTSRRGCPELTDAEAEGPSPRPQSPGRAAGAGTACSLSLPEMGPGPEAQALAKASKPLLS